MIRYSKETLYHFQCGECKGWWSVADFHILPYKTETMACPHCHYVDFFKKKKVKK